MNWTPGPARCRSPEYEAEIAFTDMGGDYPISGRARRVGCSYWTNERWGIDGRYRKGVEGPADLIPPTITREALAEECIEMYYATDKDPSWSRSMERVVAHVIDAVKAGRVE